MYNLLSSSSEQFVSKSSIELLTNNEIYWQNNNTPVVVGHFIILTIYFVENDTNQPNIVLRNLD